jgi:CRISPR/Cas system CSM-associated protein Csm3 (group 7 of RAMP superfamily)
MSLQHLYIARVQLECRTPLSIGTGKAEGVFDLELQKDANGLPAIPGSALAGVLRRTCDKTLGLEITRDLFGFADGTDDANQPSRVQVSWGVMHDSKNIPVHGLCITKEASQHLQEDPLLRFALDLRHNPMARDRVRIGHRGTVEGEGKFDRPVLPAGFRFTAEISLWSDRAQDERWTALLDMLACPDFRLGGNTRSGLGGVNVIRVNAQHFDLANAQDSQAFRRLDARFDQPHSLPQHDLAQARLANGWALTLNPRGYWRIGKGCTPSKEHNGKKADLSPYTEKRVKWDGNVGHLEDWLLVPASSIKGALRHRVSYLYRCQNGLWAENTDTGGGVAFTKAEIDLFGEASDTTKSGKAGHFVMDDILIPLNPANHSVLMHNSIDRFTGGVRDGLLFMEELVWGTPLTFSCYLLDKQVPEDSKALLRQALEDLAGGRLALGAGQNEGHGFFEGTMREIA